MKTNNTSPGNKRAIEPGTKAIFTQRPWCLCVIWTTAS